MSPVDPDALLLTASLFNEATSAGISDGDSENEMAAIADTAVNRRNT